MKIGVFLDRPKKEKKKKQATPENKISVDLKKKGEKERSTLTCMNEGKEKIRNYDEINKRNDIVGASVASFSESAIGEGEDEELLTVASDVCYYFTHLSSFFSSYF